MAEALLRSELEDRGCDDVHVASAGTWATTGQAPTDEAIAVCADHGIDLSSHLSRRLHPQELDDADVVVGMTSVHAQEVASLVPEARSKTILLKEIAETEMMPVWPDATAEEKMQALLGGVRPRWRRKLDVADPIGRPMRVYERCFQELEEGVSLLSEILCPEGEALRMQE
jgi:protein-tyrosine phosphatase